MKEEIILTRQKVKEEEIGAVKNLEEGKRKRGRRETEKRHEKEEGKREKKEGKTWKNERRRRRRRGMKKKNKERKKKTRRKIKKKEKLENLPTFEAIIGVLWSGEDERIPRNKT